MESLVGELDKFPSPWNAAIVLPNMEVRPECINSLQLYKGQLHRRLSVTFTLRLRLE